MSYVVSWIFDHVKLGHRVFIAFIELKIEGRWKHYRVREDPDAAEKLAEVLHRSRSTAETTPVNVLASEEENCLVQVIEPDGLRRILEFTKGGTISIHQNVLSYHPEQVSEITVDEKEQSGKGSTRDKL